MKKIFRNSRLIAIAFLTLFAGSITKADDSIRIKSAVPAELRYAGMINNDPLFELRVAGDPHQDDFTISISDYQGNVLYRENIRSASFSKKFLLNSEELGDEILLVEIMSRKTKKSLLYEIRSYSKVVQQVEMNGTR